MIASSSSSSSSQSPSPSTNSMIFLEPIFFYSLALDRRTFRCKFENQHVQFTRIVEMCSTHMKLTLDEYSTQCTSSFNRLMNKQTVILITFRSSSDSINISYDRSRCRRHTCRFGSLHRSIRMHIRMYMYMPPSLSMPTVPKKRAVAVAIVAHRHHRHCSFSLCLPVNT